MKTGVFDRKQTGTQVTGGLPFYQPQPQTFDLEPVLLFEYEWLMIFYTLHQLHHNFNNIYQSECMLDRLSVTFELVNNTHEAISRLYVKIDDEWIFTISDLIFGNDEFKQDRKIESNVYKVKQLG